MVNFLGMKGLFLLTAVFGLAGALQALDAPVLAVRAQTTEEIENFLSQQKPGVFLILDLKSGNSVQGRLAEYDDYYDSVWIEPAGATGRFKKKSYRLSSVHTIRLATPQDNVDLTITPE